MTEKELRKAKKDELIEMLYYLRSEIDELKAEVDKCILLCSNCHAEVHQELYDQGLLSEEE